MKAVFTERRVLVAGAALTLILAVAGGAPTTVVALTGPWFAAGLLLAFALRRRMLGGWLVVYFVWATQWWLRKMPRMLSEGVWLASDMASSDGIWSATDLMFAAMALALNFVPLLLLAWASVRLLFRRDAGAARAVGLGLWTCVAASALYAGWLALWMRVDGTLTVGPYFSQAGHFAAGCMIWVLYFRRSVRVKRFIGQESAAPALRACAVAEDATGDRGTAHRPQA